MTPPGLFLLGYAIGVAAAWGVVTRGWPAAYALNRAIAAGWSR